MKKANAEKRIADLERKLKEAEAGSTHVYHYADTDMSKNPYGFGYEVFTDRGQLIKLPNGISARVQAQQDTDYGAPWEEDDGHGIVSEWTTRSKRSGERVLVSGRNCKRFYDVQGTTKRAKKDGWGISGDTNGMARKQIIAAAVERDFQYLRRWCNDEWYWMGVIVTLFDRDDNELGQDSTWGFDSEGDYWQDVATETLDALYKGEMRTRHEAWRAKLKETRERNYWNQRDVVTA